MTETMGQIIKRLRKERNLTQEELAEQLMISSAAVSKWENGISLPDITMIIPLSNLFGVSTDVLFGVCGNDNSEEVEKALSAIFEMEENVPKEEEAKTGLLVLDKYREAIRRFPNNSTVLNNAAAFGCMLTDYNKEQLIEIVGENGINDILQECLNWSELVVKYSSSQDEVNFAKSSIIDIYFRLNRYSDACEVTKSLPSNISLLRDIALAELKWKAGETEEQLLLHCRNIKQLVYALEHQVNMLGNIYRYAGKYEEALYCYSFNRDVVNSLYREEKYRPPFHLSIYTLYQFPAYCLMKLGKIEEAIDLLEECVDFYETQLKNFNKKKELDIPLFRGCTFSYGFGGNSEYPKSRQELEKIITHTSFKSLLDNSRYVALIEKVKV